MNVRERLAQEIKKELGLTDDILKWLHMDDGPYTGTITQKLFFALLDARRRPPMKHDWVPVNTLLTSFPTYPNYPVCRVCGYVLRADGANKDKDCKGPVKITLRKHGNAKSGSRRR